MFEQVAHAKFSDQFPRFWLTINTGNLALRACLIELQGFHPSAKMTDYKDAILRAYEQACDKPDTMTWVDLILKTESKPDQTIRVMKFVLDLSSPVFLAAFKENNFSNAASLEYVITGYSETVVKSAIRRLNGYALDDIENFDAEANRILHGDLSLCERVSADFSQTRYY